MSFLEEYTKFVSKKGMTIGFNGSGYKSMRMKLIDSGKKELENLEGRSSCNYTLNKKGDSMEKRWWSGSVSNDKKRIVKPMCDNKVFCFGEKEVGSINNYSLLVDDSKDSVKKGIETFIELFSGLNDDNEIFLREKEERLKRKVLRDEKKRLREEKEAIKKGRLPV
tara:strand:- start:4690 stop:5187 length:498 start_codon:yes stop_codon:yes gene_type:complete